MFTGQCPFRRNHDLDLTPGGEKNGKALQSKNQLLYMLTSKVPLVVAKLVLDLMEAETSTTHPCRSAKDVGRELDSITVHLESIMSNSDEQRICGRLQFPIGKLYGRDPHLSILREVCNKIGACNASKIVIVSGCSGVGKSSLVKHAQQILKNGTTHFIS
eukprot:1156207-Ditylum_brightwellii.AAC.1